MFANGFNYNGLLLFHALNTTLTHTSFYEQCSLVKLIKREVHESKARGMHVQIP